MANRYNQLIDQQYVPLPFEDYLKTAQIVAKRGDDNKALLDGALAETSKLKAIPNSADEKFLRDYQGKVNELVGKYSSDPSLYTNPNAVNNFRKELRSFTDPTYLNNIQSSHDYYLKDLDSQRALAQQGKLNKKLVNSADGWDTRNKGVYSQTTPSYSPSIATTWEYIDDYKGRTIWDEGSQTHVTEINDDDLKGFAQSSATSYMFTPSFENEAKLMGVDPSTMSTQEKAGLASQILYRDFQEKKLLVERGFKPSTASDGGGSGGAAYKSALDFGYDNLHKRPSTKFASEEMDVVINQKNKDGRYTVEVGPDQGVMQIPTGTLGEADPITSYALSLYKDYRDLIAPTAGGNREITLPSGLKMNVKGHNEEDKERISQEAKAITDQLQKLGFPAKELKPDGKLGKIFHKTFGETDLINAIEGIGHQLNIGGGLFEFMPSTSTDNFINVKNPDGTSTGMIPGSLFIPEESAEQIESATNLDLSNKRFNKLVQPATMADGRKGYAVRYFKKVQVNDNTADNLNATRYTPEEVAKSMPYWQAGRLMDAGAIPTPDQKLIESIGKIENAAGDPTSTAKDSTASGLYQITDGTWDGFANKKSAKDATPKEQLEFMFTKQLPAIKGGAISLTKEYGNIFTPEEYAHLIHFQGLGGARVYLEALKRTGDPNKAQAILDDRIKRDNDGELPNNSTVQAYIDKVRANYSY
jgi:hypothetical protein